MPFNVSDVVTEARNVAPGMSSAKALEYINRAYRKMIVHKTASRGEDFTITTLTTDTREYLLNVDSAKVLNVEYYEDANTGKRLLPTSMDEMDAQFEDTWRSSTDTGEPDMFYIREVADGESAKKMIGFHPIPKEDSSSSYPQVRIHASGFGSLTTTDTLPQDTLTEEPYIYYAAYRYFASRQEFEKAGTYKILWEEAKNEQVRYSKSQNQRNGTTFLFGHVRGNRSV